MNHWFYLHFRENPPQEVLSAITELGVEIDPVFENAVDLLSPLNYSEFRHFMRTNYPELAYRIIDVRKAVTVSPDDA